MREKIKSYVKQSVVIFASWYLFYLGNWAQSTAAMNSLAWIMTIFAIVGILILFASFSQRFHEIQDTRIPFLDSLFEWHCVFFSVALAGQGYFGLAAESLIICLANYHIKPPSKSKESK